jgi:hypothetical protein
MMSTPSGATSRIADVASVSRALSVEGVSPQVKNVSRMVKFQRRGRRTLTASITTASAVLEAGRQRT